MGESSVKGKRGRPKKVRPERGESLKAGASLRDIEAATGIRRSFLKRALLIASIPEEEFERLIESDDPPTVRQLELLVRRRTGKKTMYVRRCPHCGKPLRIEHTK